MLSWGVEVNAIAVVAAWAARGAQTLAGSIGPGGQIMDRSQIDFIIRELGATAVRQGDRVQYDSRVFDVQAVANEDERGRFLRLVCMEREVG